MSENTIPEQPTEPAHSFFERPGVRVESIPIGPGVLLGIERVSNPAVGIAGAYGTWGDCYDNATLPALVENQLGYALGDDGILNLSELGFLSRHHVPRLSPEEHLELEVEVGTRFLAQPWQPAAGSLGGRGGADRHHDPGCR